MNVCKSYFVWSVFISQVYLVHSSGAQILFTKKFDSVQGGNVRVVGCTSIIECARRCFKELLCLRFSFNNKYRTCFISENTLDEQVTGGLTYGHYCPNHLGYGEAIVGLKKRCVNAGYPKMSYRNAVKQCLSEGAHLFTLEGLEDANYTTSLVVNGFVWVDGGEDYLTWNGELLPWTNWQANYPKPGECLLFGGPSLEMITTTCYIDATPVCKIDIYVSPHRLFF